MSPLLLRKGSPTHRAWQVAGYGILVLSLLLAVLTQPDFQLEKLSTAVAFAVAALGLNLVTGFSGQISLGHSAFFGLGAYTSAILVTDHGWPFLATLPVAAVLGLVIGFLVGLPALRIQGLYLALVTLGIAIVFPVVLKVSALEETTGGSNGKTIVIDWKKPGWFSLDVTNQAWELIVVSLFAAVFFLVATNLVRSRVGRALQALRDNPAGAAASGINLAAWKTGAFAASAAYAALGGCLFTMAVTIVTPDSVGFLLAIQLITAVVLGGLGTLSGNLIGGLALVFLPYYTSKWASGKSFLFFDPADSGLLANVLYGILLIAVVFVVPGGVISLVRKTRGRFIRFVPRLPEVSPPRHPVGPGDVTTPAGATRPAGEAIT